MKIGSTTIRNSRNIYVLSEIGNEKCFLGKEDETCLWNKRMGHIHFDNQPTLYASIINKERKQRPGSNQRNIQ